MRIRPATALLALIAGFTSLTAQADRTLLTGEGLQVLVPDSDVWCSQRAAVVVRGARAGDFADEARLTRLLGGLRAVLSLECPGADSILMLGTVTGTDIVYRGSARAGNDWRLVTEIAPQVAQPGVAQEGAAQRSIAQPAATPSQPSKQSTPPAPKDKNSQKKTKAPTKPEVVNPPPPPMPLPPPEEETGGGAGWIVALLALGGGAAGFVVWRRRRRSRPPQDRPPAPPPVQPPPPVVKTPPAATPPVAAAPPLPAGLSAKEQLFAEQRAKYQASIAAAMDQLTQTQMALQQHAGVPAALRRELRRLAPQLKKSIAALIRAQHAGTWQLATGALLLKPFFRFAWRLPPLFKFLVVIGLFWGIGQLLELIAAGGLPVVIAGYALALVPLAFFIERRSRLMGPLAEMEKSAGGLKHLILSYIYADQSGHVDKGELYYQAIKVASNDDQPIAGEFSLTATSFNKAVQPGTHFVGVAGAITWQIGAEGQATLVATAADNEFAKTYSEPATAAVNGARPALLAAREQLREYGDLRWLERRQRAEIPRLEAVLKNVQRLENIWAGVAADDKVFEFLLRRIDLFNMRDKATPAGILLHGYPGNGKAYLAKKIAESVFAELVPVDASGLKEAKDVKDLWGRYRGKGPVVLYVDYADQVFPKAGSEHAGGGTRETTLAWIEESAREDAARSGIWVVMSAQREDGLHPRILAQFGSSRIEIRSPGAAGRALILRNACRDNQLPETVPAWVIDGTTGSSVDDLLRIVAETRLHSYPNPPTEEQWRQAISGVRSVGSVVTDPNRTWDRLVLPGDVKEKLKRAAQILREGDKYRAKGVEVPNILLIGPPGTGKSDIARTFANVGGVKFLAPTTADLKAGYTGQSVGLVKDVFARARASAPCILFIDELDFVAARRGSPLADAFTQEIVGQMLQEMEGVAKSDRPIFVLAATNVPESVDKAILDRFTNVIEIPLPDEAGRREILVRILKEKPLEPGLNLEEVAALMAKRLPRHSGRQLVKLVDRALGKAVAAFGSPENTRLTREILLAEASPQGKVVPPEELAKIWGKIVLKPEVKELILSKIRLFNKGDKKAPKGLLLYGPSGTGKTEVARRIADSAGCFFMPLKGSDIKGALGATGQNVKGIWERARERERCVIFVDECESVFARRGSLDSDKATDESVQNFLAEWDGLGTEGQRIWVVGATNRRELLDEAIVQRFGASVEIGLPDAAGRAQIISLELEKLEYPPEVPEFVGEETQGFSGRNLSDLAKDVGTLADERGGGITPGIWREVIARYAKMAGEKVDPTARWDSLVVSEETLEKLQGVCAALRDMEVLARQGHKPPGGTLLFGPPGTGKTQIARTIANESGLPFISAKTADLKMGHTGQSGQKAKEIFQRARDRAPCVLFIDELESVAPTRGGPASDQFTNEIVTQLLQETEGATLNERHVFLLGATNLPEQVEPALLSRFDDRIEIPLPDADQRRRLFEIYLGRKKTDFDIPELAADLAKRAGRIGGRDIVKLIDRAGLRATRRARAAGSIANVVLSREDLLAELAPPGKEVPEANLAEIWSKVVLKPEVKELILSRIRLFNKADKKAPKGLLLYGPPGTGKTEIARRIADSASCFFMSLKLPDLKGDVVGASGQNVKNIWAKARARKRCVIFIDECDSVFALRGSVKADQFMTDIVQAFLAEWDGLDSEGQRVWVVGATNKRAVLDEAIVQRFGAEVEIGLPDAAQRLEILRLELARQDYAPEVPEFVAQATTGRSGRILAELVRDVGALGDQRGGITEAIWQEVIGRKAKAGGDGVDSSATWESLILADETLEKLQTICDSLRHIETLREQGVEIPRGALLYGPPGTGKTQIARTIANQSGLPFLSAATADLKAGHTGQSGQYVAELFERARGRAPCVLFIDELESVAPTRGGPSSDQFTNEIVTQMLQEMEGVKANTRHVFVLGATNHREIVDPAIRSRFEEHIEIPNPDAEQRLRLFRLFLGRQKRVDFDLDEMALELARRAGDIGGRDIRGIVQRASQQAVRRALKAGKPDQVILTRDDFKAAQPKAPP